MIAPALRAMRPHQWVKNLLLAVPFILAHRWTAPDAASSLTLLGLGIACFCLTASATYLINDLKDLDADRAHPVRKKRPLASGRLSKGAALAMAPVLFGLGLGLAFWRMPLAFALLTTGYALATLSYTMLLKRIPVLDIMVLAGFYVLRIFAGGQACQVPVSPWLLAFSLFFFLSLAFAKRAAELVSALQRDKEPGPGRPYRARDLPLFQSLGPGCGLVSVLVLALYVQGPEVVRLYARPGLLWLVCPVLLYWLVRIWLLTLRGRMEYDPLLFALRDPASYAALACAGLVFGLAAM